MSNSPSFLPEQEGKTHHAEASNKSVFWFLMAIGLIVVLVLGFSLYTGKLDPTSWLTPAETSSK